MSNLPNRAALRREFDAAVIEIDQSRPGSKLTTAFYSRIGDSVFNAGYSALADASAASDASEATAHRLHVVSAPVGSGKTSFSLAFIAAVVRLSETTGCVVVVDQMEKVVDILSELYKLFPVKVECWSSDHCVKCTKPTKVLTPAARFAKDDLQRFPVAVVTHTFYSGKESYKAKQMLHGGPLASPRSHGDRRTH